MLEHLLHTYGYVAIFIVIALENVGLPLPGETILVTSASGECTLTLLEASASHVKGTADCSNLNGGTNLKATFEATG